MTASKQNRYWGLWAATATAAALTLSACGNGEADQSAADGELIPIEVGVIPIGDVASIYVGQLEGFFEDHGIDLTLTQAQGGAAIVPVCSPATWTSGIRT